MQKTFWQMEKIISLFKVEYSELIADGLIVFNEFVEIMDTKILYGNRPFVFDARRIPLKFKGFDTRFGIRDLPVEFEINRNEFMWYERHYFQAPERYEAFVGRAMREICNDLCLPNDNREAVLDALFGGNFAKHKVETLAKRKDGLLPAWPKD